MGCHLHAQSCICQEMRQRCVWAAECGIYPGDTTNRFQTDYQQIYQTAQTPNLQNLVRLLASAPAALTFCP